MFKSVISIVCSVTSMVSPFFFLNLVTSLNFESVFMIIFPLSSRMVLKKTGSSVGYSSDIKNIFLNRYFKRILCILYLFSSLAWFYIDKIIGRWSGLLSKYLEISFIVSSKSIGLHKERSPNAWFIIGVSPSLWISISTHLSPNYRSYRYLYILESLVSWLPLR